MKKNTAYRGFKKLISLLLALILIMSLVPTQVMAAGLRALKESLEKEVWLENNAIHVDVSKNSGAFYIRTVAGDKLVKGDEYANLLWPGEDDTSFTSVRITRNGETKDYIFGKDYGSDNTVAVTNDGTQITAVWTVDGVTVTQTIRLQPTSNDAHGMVVINYGVQNNGAPAEISIRVLLDTAMGGKDYAYYNTGNTVVETERALGPDGYSRSIYMMDDPADPIVTGYILNGSVDGAESKPAKTVIAHWANLASTVYDYAPDTTLYFTNAFNAKHMTSDSAVALYYDLGGVAQGSAANAQFNYGLYSNERVKGYKVAVNLQTIDALGFTDETETAFVNDGKFTARTILQNASEKTYSKVRVYAYASGGISVLNSDGSATDATGKTYGYDNPYYVELNDFAPGQKANNLSDWNFRAVMAAEANYGRIHFKIYDMSNNYGDKPLENDLIGEVKKYILIPGSMEKLPNIQLTGSSPTIFHKEGHRVFNVTGMKFASLESEASNGAYTLKLSRKDGEMIRDNAETIELPDAGFTINEDGSGLMSVNIDGSLPVGEYKVTVDYTDAERADIDAKALEFQVIDDLRYKCETCGFVAIYHDEAADSNGRNPKHNYYAMTFADEGMYNIWREENNIQERDVLMLFKGAFDDLTENLPEGASAGLKSGEKYSTYLSATLTEDSNSNVYMSNALELSYQDPGSTVVIKEIQKGTDDDARYSIKVDFNCKVSIAGVGTMVFNQGASCFTELKSGTRYRLIDYDESGERDETVGNTICLLWPNYDMVQQSFMGAFFNFRYAELGLLPVGDQLVRTVGFGGGLDLSCIIPSADQYYSWDEMYPQDEKYKMTPDEQRAWNEAWDIRNQDRSFKEKNKDRGDAAVSNGFYDEDDNFNYSGSVQVSDILFGAQSFLGFNISIGVGIPPLAYGLPAVEGVFSLRTIGQTEFQVNGSMQFMDFELEALLNLKSNDIGILIPDEFKFFIGGVTPGIPLDPWGVFWLQGGGGGIKDLYETIYLQDKVPPLKLILQAQFSLMQVMVAKATVEVGLTGLGVALSDVKIIGTDIGVMDSAVIAIRWYPNFALIASVQVDLLDFIQAGGYIVGYVNYDGTNPFFEFFVRGALHLPGNIPIVGGMTVGDVNMGISTERIFGKAEVMGVGIGFSYYWKNEFDWGMKNEASPTFPELLGLGQEFDSDIDEMFENIPTPDDGDSTRPIAALGSGKAIPVYYDEENHRTLMAVPGTNFISSNTVVLHGEGGGSGSGDVNTLNIAPDGKTVEAQFANNGKSKIVILTWDSDSEAAAKQQAAAISTGDYALTMLNHEVDANEQKTANANLTYDAEAKQASLAITVTDPAVRELHIASTAFGMDAVLYDVDALPELSTGSAVLNGSELDLHVSGTKLDSFDYVNVGVIRQSELAAAEADSEYVPEITLVGRAEKVNGQLPRSFTAELPADLPSGDYVVRLMAQDEAQTQISQLDLTGSVVSFVNPNTPGDPTGIGNIINAGDWKVNVPINPGNSDDFDGYALSVTDAEGAPVSGLTDLLFYRNGEIVQYDSDGKVTVPAENPLAEYVTIGGHLELPADAADGANEAEQTEPQIVGFRVGDYTVSVQKWKAANGTPVYSKAVTAGFHVIAPNPAAITVTGTDTVTRTEQRGEETVAIPWYTTDELVFTVNATRPVTGSWVIDNLSMEDGYHGTVDTLTSSAELSFVGLDLADGIHSLTFTGTDSGGNVAGASFTFGVDNMAPAILISSPENGSTFDGATGAVTFTGTTDANATLELFDKTTGSSLAPTVQIDESTGDFTATVALENGAAIRQITLRASDDLGNASEKTFTLRSSLLSSVTGLYLYEGDDDRTEQTLTAGSHTLRLVGKTEDGQIVEMSDPSMLEWDAQTLEGTALEASLSEDGTQFIVTAAQDSVGVITAQLLVNEAGTYPVSCMIGSTLSVSTDEITVETGETAPLGVSSRTGAVLTYTSADPTVATVSTDSDGIAVITGVKDGTTTVTVTASTGETATVTVIVTRIAYLVGNSISLDGDIGINFFADLHKVARETAKIVFTWGSESDPKREEVSLDGMTPDANDYFRLTARVAASQMTDVIHAELYDGETKIAETDYSVAQYARYVLNGSDDELLPFVNNDAEKLGKLRELCKAMLIYGAKAQIQFNYPTDDPADAGLQYTLEDVGELGATTFPEGFKDACGIQYAGSSLVLETKTTYRLYFNVTDQSLLEGLTVKLGNETLTPVNKGSYVCYEITDIPAARVLSDYTLTFGEQTVTANPGEYIRKALATNNETLRQAVKALYWYAKAAQTYFGVQ